MSKPSRRPVSIARLGDLHRRLAGDDRQARHAAPARPAAPAAAARPGAGCRGSPAARVARSRSRSRSAELARGGGLAGALQTRPSGSGSAPRALRLSGTAPSPPSASIITSLTILTTCWPGVTEASTSAPTARSRTLAMKSRTTGSATSASSSARRTSRSASVTSASLSAPRPRSRSKTPDSLSDSASNTGDVTPNAPPRDTSHYAPSLDT